MDLLKGICSEPEDTEHWVAFENNRTPPDLLPLDNFRQKLDKALNDLGRVDYALQESICSLRADMHDTHDGLHSRLSEIVEPEFNTAVSELAEAISRTMDMVDGVLADNRIRKQ